MEQDAGTDVETINDFLVGVQGDDLVLVLGVGAGYLEREKALRLAAWIVVLTSEEEFARTLAAVKST